MRIGYGTYKKIVYRRVYGPKNKQKKCPKHFSLGHFIKLNIFNYHIVHATEPKTFQIFNA